MNRRQDNFQQSNSTQANYPVEYTAHQYEGTLSFNQNQQQEQPKTVGTKMGKLIMVICANNFFKISGFFTTKNFRPQPTKFRTPRNEPKRNSGRKRLTGRHNLFLKLILSSCSYPSLLLLFPLLSYVGREVRK